MNTQRLKSQTPAPMLKSQNETALLDTPPRLQAPATKSQNDTLTNPARAGTPRRNPQTLAKTLTKWFVGGLAASSLLHKGLARAQVPFSAPPPPAFNGDSLWCRPYNADTVQTSMTGVTGDACELFPPTWQQNTTLVGQPQPLRQILDSLGNASCTTQAMAFRCTGNEGVLLANEQFCNAVDVLNTFCQPLTIYKPSLVSGLAQDIQRAWLPFSENKYFSMVEANHTFLNLTESQTVGVPANMPMGLFVQYSPEQLSNRFWSVIRQNILGEFSWSSSCDVDYVQPQDYLVEGHAARNLSAAENWNCGNPSSPKMPPYLSPPPDYEYSPETTSGDFSPGYPNMTMRNKAFYGLGVGISALPYVIYSVCRLARLGNLNRAIRSHGQQRG